MTIEVFERVQYGTVRMFVANTAAREPILRLTRCRTVSQEHLNALKMMGHEVVFVQDPQIKERFQVPLDKHTVEIVARAMDDAGM